MFNQKAILFLLPEIFSVDFRKIKINSPFFRKITKIEFYKHSFYQFFLLPFLWLLNIFPEILYLSL